LEFIWSQNIQHQLPSIQLYLQLRFDLKAKQVKFDIEAARHQGNPAVNSLSNLLIPPSTNLRRKQRGPVILAFRNFFFGLLTTMQVEE
jgi:hypothetical protein